MSESYSIRHFHTLTSWMDTGRTGRPGIQDRTPQTGGCVQLTAPSRTTGEVRRKTGGRLPPHLHCGPDRDHRPRWSRSPRSKAAARKTRIANTAGDQWIALPRHRRSAQSERRQHRGTMPPKTERFTVDAIIARPAVSPWRNQSRGGRAKPGSFLGRATRRTRRGAFGSLVV